MTHPINVAIIGATGLVGRHVVATLSHSHFNVTHLVGSPASTGRSYKDVWTEKETALRRHYGDWWTPLAFPESIPDRPIVGVETIPDSTIVISSVPERAGADEDALFHRGCTVISNSPYRRLDPTLPLIVPGTEPITPQTPYIKIPNCTSIGLSLGLFPIFDLIREFPITVSTYQSISGRGDAKYAPSLAMGNVFPLRGSPEGTEALIMGELARVMPSLRLSVSCYRIPTQVGHLMDVAIHHDGQLDIAELLDRWTIPGIVLTDIGHPQSHHDAFHNNGMDIAIGNIANHSGGEILRFSIVVNNLIRGAAGSLILALYDVTS
jgi:aspartate-semialdehyde dehydrogenase